MHSNTESSKQSLYKQDLNFEEERREQKNLYTAIKRDQRWASKWDVSKGFVKVLVSSMPSRNEKHTYPASIHGRGPNSLKHQEAHLITWQYEWCMIQ